MASRSSPTSSTRWPARTPKMSTPMARSKPAVRDALGPQPSFTFRKPKPWSTETVRGDKPPKKTRPPARPHHREGRAMSTRCVVNFRDAEKTILAKVYRHSDGYPGPDGIGRDLERFFDDVETQCPGDTRFDDPCYLAAK